MKPSTRGTMVTIRSSEMVPKDRLDSSLDGNQIGKHMYTAANTV